MKPIKDKATEVELIEYLKENDSRIYMFYLILRFTGFRASDVLPLKVKDVVGEYITIRERKTINRQHKEERSVLIHRDLKRELKKYIKDKTNNDVLFPSAQGYNKALSYTQAYRILKKASVLIGIKDFGTHSGRKTCAYGIYMKTHDLNKVKNFLMHDNKKDTIRYVGIEKEVRNDTIKDIDSPFD